MGKGLLDELAGVADHEQQQAWDESEQGLSPAVFACRGCECFRHFDFLLGSYQGIVLIKPARISAARRQQSRMAQVSSDKSWRFADMAILLLELVKIGIFESIREFGNLC